MRSIDHPRYLRECEKNSHRRIPSKKKKNNHLGKPPRATPPPLPLTSQEPNDLPISLHEHPQISLNTHTFLPSRKILSIGPASTEGCRALFSPLGTMRSPNTGSRTRLCHEAPRLIYSPVLEAVGKEIRRCGRGSGGCCCGRACRSTHGLSM